MSETSTPLVLRGRAQEYLYNQRGEFQHLYEDRAAWARALYDEVQKTVYQLGAFLPRSPERVLDIGAGLGIADVMLIKNSDCICTLVDGEDGTGVCEKHAIPFGNRKVVEEFFNDNHIAKDRWQYANPVQLFEDTRKYPVYDLVISFRSWCFHYPPADYMGFVQQHIAPGTRLMLDVRRERDWRAQLNATWPENLVVERGDKFDRMLYVVKGRLQ